MKIGGLDLVHLAAAQRNTTGRTIKRRNINLPLLGSMNQCARNFQGWNVCHMLHVES